MSNVGKSREGVANSNQPTAQRLPAYSSPDRLLLGDLEDYYIQFRDEYTLAIVLSKRLNIIFKADLLLSIDQSVRGRMVRKYFCNPWQEVVAKS